MRVGLPSILSVLLGLPVLIAAFSILGPFKVDSIYGWSGISFNTQPGWLPGFPSIDPNVGVTSFALGARAAHDLLAGVLPLWNPYEGLGAPLLGEMQSAALFPPTLLLALPHGQIVEQSLLQAIAGAGTYLFLRRFGLGRTAALAGAVLFEVNGVFAWLRNAVFNPVAFLPWLYWLAESLFAAQRIGSGWRERCPTVLLGALSAALAIYAGFPEVVYFYCIPVLLWIAYRAACLPWRRVLFYFGDLAACACLAAILAAPLLLAFGQFLAVAELGQHRGQGTTGEVISPAATLMYLLPYIYGPIWAAPQQQIAALWRVGGYLGLMPALLAAAGLIAGWRRPAVWVLAFWVFVAIGASHGLPGIYAAFVRLPLTGVAFYSRYLNAGWLFDCAVLSAMFIEQVGTASRASWRRAGVLGALVILGLVVGALTLGWAPLMAEWDAHRGQRAYVVASLLTGGVLMLGFLAWLRARRARVGLVGLLLGEAIVAFLVPFASNMRFARNDWTLVDYLRRHAGRQRVAIAFGAGLSPNYGSAYGIAFINYDDLPVPARTVEYVRRELDPDVSPTIFRPNDHPVPEEVARERFLQRLAGYEAAGTRYYLADATFFSRPAYPMVGNLEPISLSPGQELTLELAAGAETTAIQGVMLLVGTFGGTADGLLRARLCHVGVCGEGVAATATAADNKFLPVRFGASVPVTPLAPYRLSITYEGGRRDVALWAGRSDAARGQALTPPWNGSLPQLRLVPGGAPWPVLTTPETTIFEQQDYRLYATAPGCRIDASARDHLVADCAHASRLLRLELFMPGWVAEVDGRQAEIVPAEDTFQAVDLPAGRSTVDFRFAPFLVRLAAAVAAATLLGMLLLLARSLRRPRRE